MKRIYLDHAAATFLRPEAKEAMISAMEIVGNPSSVHGEGRVMAGLLNKARRKVADLMGVKSEEIIFTSGATEAIAMGMTGVFLANEKKGILISPFVHSAVWNTAQMLEKRFEAQIYTIPVTKNGQWDLEKLKHDFNFSDLGLLAVDHVGSELGIVQDELGLVNIVKEKSNAVILTDWAASIVSEDIVTGNADMWGLSGEKFGAPAGIGVLYKKKAVAFDPLIAGTHELGMRPGTQNSLGAVGLAEALEAHLKEKEMLIKKWNGFDSDFGLEKTTQKTAAHIHHFMLPEGMAGDVFVAKADMAGVAISSGTACSSGAQKPSRALMALGYSEADAKRGIRLSIGWDTTEEEVKEACERLRGLL